MMSTMIDRAPKLTDVRIRRSPISPAAQTTWQLVVMLVLSWRPAAAAATPSPGSWIGQTDLGGVPFYSKLVMTHAGAKIHLPQLGVAYKPVGFGASDDDSLRLVSGDTTLVARAGGDSIVGTLRLGPRAGRIRLLRYRPMGAEAEGLSGAYVAEGGGYLYVHRLGDGVLVDDLESGRTYGLWGAAGADSDLIGVLPLDSRGPFAGVGRLIAGHLEVGSGRQRVTAARSEPWREEPVRIEGDGPVMAGVLKTPSAPGRHPLVVIVPGAGDSDHTAYGAIQALFALHGCVVFAYDKRGVGGSQGNYDTAEFDSLAADVVRAVRSLAGRAEVDSDRVFLWGHSQGAWLAPLAARQLPRLAGLFLVSWSSETPPAQTIGWLEKHLRNGKLSPVEIEAALQYENTAFRVVRAHGEGWNVLEALIPSARESRWWDSVPQPESKEALLHWPGFFFDPIPVLRDIRVPTLAIYGRNDVNVRADESAAVMRKVLGRRVTVQIYEGAEHELRLVKSGSDDDFAWMDSPGYAAGYFDAMTRWMRANGGK